MANTKRRPGSRYDRALVLRALGQEAAARKDLERIVATDAGYRDVRQLLADTH